MSEFRIHHDVNDLISLLRLHGNEGSRIIHRSPAEEPHSVCHLTTSVSAHSRKVRAAVSPIPFFSILFSQHLTT
uniref:Uncharacterized protein n=1 Tax=Leptobrachium leishanense TaxID=445787 RepID=A0A8C5W9R9_9ANUR